MASGESPDDERDRDPDLEAERYRRAAAHALGQLEWIVAYLHKVRKSELARALDRNRKQIQERIS
jgi:hypothetical protein